MFNCEGNEKRVTYTVDALAKADMFQPASDIDASLYDRIKDIEISSEVLAEIENRVSVIGVTDEFKKVIETFKPAAGITPAGFRQELEFGGDKSLRIDLKRISPLWKTASEGRPTYCIPPTRLTRLRSWP